MESEEWTKEDQHRLRRLRHDDTWIKFENMLRAELNDRDVLSIQPLGQMSQFDLGHAQGQLHGMLDLLGKLDTHTEDLEDDAED
jgi:hypothetical protein